MKVTMSKDGTPRGILTIKVRVSLEDLVNGIGWTIMRDWTFHDAPNIAMRVEAAMKMLRSKKSILSAFESAFKSDADSIWTWSEGFNETASKEIKEQATVLIRKKFPALYRMEAPK